MKKLKSGQKGSLRTFKVQIAIESQQMIVKGRTATEARNKALEKVRKGIAKGGIKGKYLDKLNTWEDEQLNF